ncbi:MAG TPA: hypothetical protein PLD88_03135, partial [Candidatus Berkiella sp.]|nr:hypothetical protein [Candidatus Berkiella sp.]
MVIAKRTTQRPPAPAAPKMHLFSYECTNTQGLKVQGKVSAANITLAKADLRRQGLNPISVRRQSTPLFAKRRKKVSTAEISHFSRQMA